MKVQLASPTLASIDQVHSDSMCIFIFEDARPLKGLAGLVDWRVGARISSLLADGWLTGRAGERFLMPVKHRLPVSKLFGFGLGPIGTFDPESQAALVRRAFEILNEAGVHGTILTAPGRAEGFSTDLKGIDAVCASLDIARDFDEVVIVDEFRRQQEAWHLIDLHLKPLLGIA